MATSPKRATGTQAVDRAADLLVEVLKSEKPVTFSYLTNKSGLAKGTASRLISALERNGLLQRNKKGEIETGITINQFASRISSINRLVSKLQPLMRQIGNETGETISLAISGNDAVENIAQIDAKYLLSSRNWIGQKVPYHASAAGKVLLAFQNIDISKIKLDKLTNSTIVAKADLENEISKVRNNNYAVIIDELEMGLVAISVPVKNETGEVIAALSVSGPSARLNQQKIKEIISLLKKYSKNLDLSLIENNENNRGAA
ncbi:MAG: IclR family transcriptional regulator [Candidatus Nanopelagicales bacterium]